ncbi:50S ribosomal protein L21e [Candidatus Bathyarchaeota archaeon]|nr:50S ribosomal protein L21e [Candidatus Bathyarchaeota archaeon]
MKSKGFRRKSRHVLTKKPRERGLQPLGRLLHEYEEGEKVVVKIDSAVQKGMPHTRYQGRVGVVAEKRGRAYVVKMQEGGKVRNLIILPEHITSLAT